MLGQGGSSGSQGEVTLLEFAYNDYLLNLGLKSKAIKHLKSIAQGLFKMYS